MAPVLRGLSMIWGQDAHNHLNHKPLNCRSHSLNSTTPHPGIYPILARNHQTRLVRVRRRHVEVKQIHNK